LTDCCLGYYYEGFLAVQRAVDLSIIQELTGVSGQVNSNNVGMQLKSFPYPPYLSDRFITVLTAQFPFIIMISFIVIAPTICKEVVLEKEKKLKVC
jgi:ATP-binding cassette, subfamily A (ABC1), member 3